VALSFRQDALAYPSSKSDVRRVRVEVAALVGARAGILPDAGVLPATRLPGIRRGFA